MKHLKHTLLVLAIGLCVCVPLTAQTSAPVSAVTLNVGQKTTATVVPVEADGATPSGAALSNVAWSCGGPSWTSTANPDNTLTITGTQVSNGAPTCTVTFTATDSDGLAQTFSFTFSVTVNPSSTPLKTRTAGGIVTFSPPQ